MSKNICRFLPKNTCRSQPICNLACDYCFYHAKDTLYLENSSFNMSDEVVEAYICSYYKSQPGPVVSFAWQGGEPTLLDLDFFHKVLQLENKHLPPGYKYKNAFQTNGIFITSTAMTSKETLPTQE